MRQNVLKVLLVAAVLGAAWAYVHWPRVTEVETGRTPEYPDLKVRDYMTSEDKVAKAARATVERLPAWTFVAQGKGPGGAEIQAKARTPWVRSDADVVVRVRREGGRTRVTVRSRWSVGPMDFGQNARTIQLFLAELDQELFGVGSGKPL
jgi:hypothetical protein